MIDFYEIIKASRANDQSLRHIIPHNQFLFMNQKYKKVNILDTYYNKKLLTLNIFIFFKKGYLILSI